MTNQSIRILMIQMLLLMIQYVLLYGCSFHLRRRYNNQAISGIKTYTRAKNAVSYFLWVPMVLLLPVLIYFCSPKIYVVYITAIMFSILLITAELVSFPAAFIRTIPGKRSYDEEQVSSGSSKYVGIAPSVHFTYGMLGILSVLICPGMNIALKIVVIFIAGRIMVASYWTKQHAAADFAMAVPVSVIAFMFAWVYSIQYGPDAILAALGL